jgi:hypothetical protein
MNTATAEINTITPSGTKLFKVSDEKTTEEALFIGVQLEFPKVFSTTLEVHLAFVDTYFDEMGASGHYWLMGEKFKDVVVRELGYSQMNMSKEAIKASTQFHSDKTVVQMILRMTNPESTEEECGYVESELKEYMTAGYISNFQQFCL